ncbi:hypothetical protein [Pseudoalteromonas sp. T1lg48]|uniref:hypothetical protein n=1 Tax=Pseudoalteromonas sp. T1lg48 TaxID=2077100 RepID=UPI000CF63B26|nr:hypothetical protein [Pseudoalteromonas sp. T1lg48]
MKNLLILAALGAAIYYFYNNTDTITSIITPEREMVYAQARITYNLPGREIEMIGVGHRYKEGACDANLVQDFVDQCVEENFCSHVTFECKESLDKRYASMLQQQPARTHYIHLNGNRDARKGALIFWGLTDQEAKKVCTSITADINRKNDWDMTAQCI